VQEAGQIAGRFASRCRSQWEGTEVFLLKGRARVDGGDFLFEGRFAFWGDVPGGRVRGDLCGPDGMPVLSWYADSSGALFYLPRDEAAFLHPAGISTGAFLLDVRDLLFLARTGFPHPMEAWQIVEGAVPSGGSVTWSFDPPDAGILVRLDPGALFPSSISWEGGCASILSASMHDEYRAWPSSWRVEAGGITALIDMRSFDAAAEPWPGLWELDIPVSASLETLQPPPGIAPSWVLPVR